MPEITVDFRAPPPSPVASGRRSSVTNDEVLTEYLEASVRVPDLILPDKIFPKQKHLDPPPEVDFVSLCLHRDDALRDLVSDSLARIGCFQLLNHGIPLQLMAAASEAAAGIFEVPPAMRGSATRSPENPWGFEEYHAGEEEGDGSEEFVWCNDHQFKSKMEGIWPMGYPNFSEKMEKVMARIEKVGREMLGVILEKGNIENVGGFGSVCCVYKHGSSSDRSLKYDVIRMLIRGTDYSHSLCFHICNASKHFHLYSKKYCLSFSPHPSALVVTAGDQTQILSGGLYKHVIGRPVFKGEKEESISMAFLCSTQNTNNNFQSSGGRTISLAQQAFLALILPLVYNVMIFVYKKLDEMQNTHL